MPHTEHLRQHVLETKIIPPRANRRTMARTRLVAKLKEALDYRLTILQAPVGYGKTTALVGLAEAAAPANARVAWYSITEDDTDPEHFLAHLIASIQRALPSLSEAPIVALDQVLRSGTERDWRLVIDRLINAIIQSIGETPLVLIEEDYHLISRARVVTDLQERLINYMPPNMHVVVSVRHPLDDPALSVWRARGDVLDIGPADLTFSVDDIKALFADVLGTPLSEADARFVAERTEGFPMALQLVWQALRSGGNAVHVRDVLASSSAASTDASPSLNALFDVLTRNVLNQLRPELGEFLRSTSILRVLLPEACDALVASNNATRILQRLHSQGLFIVSVGQRQYRYHALFQDFLRAQLSPSEALALHKRAAAFYRQVGNWPEALYHTFTAGDLDQAAEDLVQYGGQALQLGQIDTLNERINALPPEMLLKHPRLQLYLGDICRMRNRFQEAQQWYAQAENLWRARGDRAGISQALSAKAMVHLDTMQPALAQELLEQAIALSEGIADQLTHARTLEMLAENKLNLGFPDEAERLRQQAQALRSGNSSEDALSVRVKIRTGRLAEAQAILEKWAEAEGQSSHVRLPHAYRETKLLLAFVHVLQGEVQAALPYIYESIELGEQNQLPFVSAMAQVRLGDARQLMADDSEALADAIRCYRSAIDTGRQLAVSRVQVTALRGLARAYGMSGDLDAARTVAREGVALGKQVGDGWIAAHVELALGSALAFAHQHAEAIDVLRRAVDGFRHVGDEFCLAAAWLWLALAYRESKQPEYANAALNEALSRCLAQGYDFLLTRPSLLGSPDLRRMFPLLAELSTQHNDRHARYAAQLLAKAGLPHLELHPGYQLRVFTLGEFRVWRAGHEVQSSEWQRDKARQLFQLLITRRGRRLQREEITETLWSDVKPDAAWRDFRVALNALFKALEPNRNADAPSAYIGRDGSAYFLRPEADLWIDAVVLEKACEAALNAPENAEVLEQLEKALNAYSGDYLADAVHETWVLAERERLRELSLRAMETLASARLAQQRPASAVYWCEQILARDNCRESAYRIAMRAHDAQGNRAQAMRMFERCMNTLRDELGVSPSPQTLAVHEALLRETP